MYPWSSDLQRHAVAATPCSRRCRIIIRCLLLPMMPWHSDRWHIHVENSH